MFGGKGGSVTYCSGKSALVKEEEEKVFLAVCVSLSVLHRLLASFINQSFRLKVALTVPEKKQKTNKHTNISSATGRGNDETRLD